MSDQKDDLNQPSVEQGSEDPASGWDEQLGSEEALEQPKEEENDLGVDSKWLPEEGEDSNQNQLLQIYLKMKRRMCR